MNTSWVRVRLGDLAHVKHGFAFSGMSENVAPPAPVVVGIGNFDYSGGFRFESTTIKRYAGDYPAEFKLKPGDVLLAMTCQTPGGEILGIPGRVPGDGVIYLHNQRLGKVDITDTERLDPNFMYQLARWGIFNRHLYVTASGSKILHTSPTRIEEFSFDLPALGEQQAIAATLGALDDKIESNQRTINKSIALARALYRQALTAGCREVTVRDVAEFHNRRRVPLSSQEREARPGDIPYYGATGIFGYVNEFLFNEILVLVGEDGSVVRNDGGPVIQYIWGKAWINNHAHPLTGQGISNELLYLALDRSDIRPLVTGAVQPKISMGNLKTLALKLPAEAAQAGLEARLASLFALWRGRANEARHLEQLRDTLLPELLSGRIRVPEAHDAMKEVIG